MLNATAIGNAVTRLIDDLQRASDKVEDVRISGYTDMYGRDGVEGGYIVKVVGTITQSVNIPVVD